MKKDHSTFKYKASLRRSLLREIADPVVLEAFGGWGRLYRECYGDVARGVVIEKDPRRSAFLARQRPTWAVYEADCVKALADGLGSHLAVNLLDLDPWGEPWPALEAFFGSEREFPQRLGVAVTDGLRQGTVRIGRACTMTSLAAAVDRYGNVDIFDHYLEICQELLGEIVQRAGYELTRWTGYYCGAGQGMTHYAAVCQR